MYEPTRHFLDCHVAGLSYWDAAVVHDELKPGCELTLEAEADNPYDPQAVTVSYDGTKIGYIPRNNNTQISQLLFFGHDNIFEARVSQVDLTAPLEHQVHMTVLIKDIRKYV